MAIATITVSGKVVTPSGGDWANGEIAIRISAEGTVDDAGTEQVIAGTSFESIDANGNVSFELVPNDNITPATTVYLVQFRSTTGRKFAETWTIAAADADPIEIGNVTRP